MPSLVEIGPVFLEETVLKFCQCIYMLAIFVIISPLKMGVVLHLNMLNPCHLRLLCAKFVEICPAILLKKILTYCQSYYFPLEKGVAIQLNKL